jgi:iron only hydrogenase large subunit-like protein
MSFYHALRIQEDACFGCTHCIKACPTEALRVRNGKAYLIAERCIDCGACMKICPAGAIRVEEDDIEKIYHYKARVALVPSVFIGQFPRNIPTLKIYNGILKEGFTHVYESEHGAGILIEKINEYNEKNESIRPAISSFCPAIVRMIQVRFPSLVNNIMLLKAPLDIASLSIRKKLISQGFSEEEIGVFYITPCAAKITAVKSPVGEEKSPINGVIRLDSLFKRVLTAINKGGKEQQAIPEKEQLFPGEMVWSLTGGEAKHIKGRCLSIDGVQNAIDFLEKIENDAIGRFDFIEMRACDESCAGGILTTTNRFLISERLHKRAEQYYIDKEKGIINDTKTTHKYREYLLAQSGISRIDPRSVIKLDEDMVQAMKKMGKIGKIASYLPGIDCGACGSPTCRALAEDVVQHRAKTNDCVFVSMKVRGNDEAGDDTQKIWGKGRFDKLLP